MLKFQYDVWFESLASVIVYFKIHFIFMIHNTWQF